MEREAWDRRYHGTELLWTAEPNRFVAAELRDLPPGRALDLGAGAGRNAVWLAERGWRVTAVDFSSGPGQGTGAGAGARRQRGLGVGRLARLPARAGRLRPGASGLPASAPGRARRGAARRRDGAGPARHAAGGGP